MFRITQLRKAMGINMSEAARLLNLPYTTYVNYEKGLREPTSEVLIQIADFFNVTIDYLVGRDTKPSNESVGLSGEVSAPEPKLIEQNIIRIAARDGSYQERRLSNEQLAALKAILDQMPDVPDDL